MTLSYYNKSPESFEELIKLAVQKMNKKFNDDNHIVYLVWQGQFTETVSCSHAAPKDKSTNWGGNYDRPVSYPGWEGRVWVSYRCDRLAIGFGSDILQGTGIHSGTGGYGLYGLLDSINLDPKYHKPEGHKNTYGHYPLSYDSKIFELDFPGLCDFKEHLKNKRKEYTTRQVVYELKNKYLKPFEYSYPKVQVAYVNPNYATI